MFTAGEIPESTIVPIWLYIVNAIELLVNMISICVGVLVARTVVRHKIFHVNLRFLMNIMGCGWFLLVGSRAASLIHQFVQTEGMREFFKISCWIQ